MSILDSLLAVARTASSQPARVGQTVRQFVTMRGRLLDKTVKPIETPQPFLHAENNPIGKILKPVLGQLRTNQALALAKIPPQFLKEQTKVTQAQIAWAVALSNALDVYERSPHTKDYLDKHGPQKIDHFGIRTLARHDFKQVLEYLGYTKQGDMDFREASLVGSGFHNKEHGVDIPMYFLSEWQAHINNHTKKLEFLASWHESYRHEPASMYDAHKNLRQLSRHGEIDYLGAVNIVANVASMFKHNYMDVAKGDYTNLTREEFDACLKEGADALAWILTNGQHPNHLAITVNPEEFASIRESLRSQYGEFLPVQTSANGLLYQTANRAETIPFTFRTEGGKFVTNDVLGPFLEFCARSYDPTTGKPYVGFDAGNARNIFNYSTVINPNSVESSVDAVESSVDSVTAEMLNPSIIGKNADS